MSDDRSFDDVMADIAIRSATNGGPGIVDVLEAIRASHEDARKATGRIASHLDSEAGKIDRTLQEHFTEARERDARLAKLETAAAACPALIAEGRRETDAEHKAFHKEYLATLVLPSLMAAPKRRDDPEGENFEGDRRTYLMWVIGSKIGYVALAVLVALIVMVGNYLVLGRP